MLIEHLKNRFTAKWWDEKEVESDKLKIILESAYLAPSKNGEYKHKIIVLTDSDYGKDFKKWLYYENTWCDEKGRRAVSPSKNKRFNGQILAPVVLIYLVEENSHSNLEDLIKKYYTDTIVSATVAMCAAEELGLNTGFNSTLGGKEVSKKLGYENMIATISLGIGYASSDLRVRRGVYDENEERIGWDYSNTTSRLIIADNRNNKPMFNELVEIK